MEKDDKRHKNNYDYKVRYIQLVVGDLVLLRRMAFQGKHKIQDHWEDTIYCVDRQPCAGLPIFRIAPVPGKGKVKNAHQNLLLPFGGNIEEDSEKGKLTRCQWTSGLHPNSLWWGGFQRLKLCQQIFNLRVRVNAILVQGVQTMEKQNYCFKHYGDGYMDTNNVKLSHRVTKVHPLIYLIP